jgi:hypothetical protein
MTQLPELGQLKEVAVRQAWPHEARVFTPWLAENLDHLSDSIGLRLELVGCEVSVGRYSADIVASTVLDNKIVLIENQLERSDHTHLGQIMTYLAGTEARIIVWTAPEFSDEHLSAVRWLNQHSHEEFSFFAVRIRVMQIGQSALAPLFEVLEKPNGWERSLHQEVRASVQSGDLANLRRAFWHRYTQLYPEIAEQPARGGNSSRWLEMPNRPVIISRYKAAEEVGIFIRGLGGVDAQTRAEVVAPYVPQMIERLGIEPGMTNAFQTIGPLISEDPSTWDQGIHWMEEQTYRYKEAIEAIIPETPR